MTGCLLSSRESAISRKIPAGSILRAWQGLLPWNLAKQLENLAPCALESAFRPRAPYLLHRRRPAHQREAPGMLRPDRVPSPSLRRSRYPASHITVRRSSGCDPRPRLLLEGSLSFRARRDAGSLPEAPMARKSSGGAAHGLHQQKAGSHGRRKNGT